MKSAIPTVRSIRRDVMTPQSENDDAPAGAPNKGGGVFAEIPRSSSNDFSRGSFVDAAYQRKWMGILKTVEPLMTAIIRHPGVVAESQTKAEALRLLIDGSRSMAADLSSLVPDGTYMKGQISQVAANLMADWWVSGRGVGQNEIVGMLKSAAETTDFADATAWMTEESWPQQVESADDARSRLRVSLLRALGTIAPLTASPLLARQQDLLSRAASEILRIATQSNQRYLDVSANYRLMQNQGDINRVAALFEAELRRAGGELARQFNDRLRVDGKAAAQTWLDANIGERIDTAFANTEKSFVSLIRIVDGIIEHEHPTEGNHHRG